MEYILAIKIPAFVSSDPALWFEMFESIFELAVAKPIANERIKCNFYVALFSPDATVAVRDQLPLNAQSILARIQPLTSKSFRGNYRTSEVRPVHVSAVSKYPSANSDDCSESKLLKELKLLRRKLILKEGRFVLGTFRSKRMRVLYRSRQNDRLCVMLVLVNIDITPPHTPLPVFRRIGERTIAYSWRACKQLRHLVGLVIRA
ncbi:uncharacterized protein TNCV_1783731 [Trichonephila clavipes]|nr:uncharacterized protein TNCV_1783731 [Trichonephila clavipes]